MSFVSSYSRTLQMKLLSHTRVHVQVTSLRSAPYPCWSRPIVLLDSQADMAEAPGLLLIAKVSVIKDIIFPNTGLAGYVPPFNAVDPDTAWI